MSTRRFRRMRRRARLVALIQCSLKSCRFRQVTPPLNCLSVPYPEKQDEPCLGRTSSPMSKKLHNYLLTHRKRSGLSQDEVAFLLGRRSGTKVSRHESFARMPGPRTLLAYEAIFR